jgi:hypothetical protein
VLYRTYNLLLNSWRLEDYKCALDAQNELLWNETKHLFHTSMDKKDAILHFFFMLEVVHDGCLDIKLTKRKSK